MTISKSLEDAYKATRYQTFLERSIAIIRIGERCRKLDDLCDEHFVASWAFITACNPLSRLLSDDENQHRQQLLESLLRAGKFEYFAGEGIGETGDWPSEPSFLVPGISQKNH